MTSLWTSQNTPTDNAWRSVTYGNGLFVALANSGTGNRVMTSPDGITWSLQTTPNNNWYDVTYGNGLFVAVANQNGIMTSSNGINWISRTSALSRHWDSITYGNGLFVAVATSGTGNRVMTSPDGINWTSRNTPADNFWYGVTYGNGLFVAVASSGTGNRVMTFYLNLPLITNFSIQTKPLGNKPFKINPPTSNSPGSFSYTSSNLSVATISGNTITIVGAGSSTITATQQATANYASGTITATFVVNSSTETTPTIITDIDQLNYVMTTNAKYVDIQNNLGYFLSNLYSNSSKILFNTTTKPKTITFKSYGNPLSVFNSMFGPPASPYSINYPGVYNTIVNSKYYLNMPSGVFMAWGGPGEYSVYKETNNNFGKIKLEINVANVQGNAFVFRKAFTSNYAFIGSFYIIQPLVNGANTFTVTSNYGNNNVGVEQVGIAVESNIYSNTTCNILGVNIQYI